MNFYKNTNFFIVPVMLLGLLVSKTMAEKKEDSAENRNEKERYRYKVTSTPIFDHNGKVRSRKIQYSDGTTLIKSVSPNNLQSKSGDPVDRTVDSDSNERLIPEDRGEALQMAQRLQELLRELDQKKAALQAEKGEAEEKLERQQSDRNKAKNTLFFYNSMLATVPAKQDLARFRCPNGHSVGECNHYRLQEQHRERLERTHKYNQSLKARRANLKNTVITMENKIAELDQYITFGEVNIERYQEELESVQQERLQWLDYVKPLTDRLSRSIQSFDIFDE